MHTHIQDLIQMDQKSLFPKLDPRLVVYLEGFCLPTLFEHNLRCVLMEARNTLPFFCFCTRAELWCAERQTAVLFKGQMAKAEGTR